MDADTLLVIVRSWEGLSEEEWRELRYVVR